MKKRYSRSQLETMLKSAVKNLQTAVAVAQRATDEATKARLENTQYLKDLGKYADLLREKNTEIESLREQLVVDEALRKVPPANAIPC